MSRFEFQYIPYPLWRRNWPQWLRPAVRSLAHIAYPVQEDETPPHDPAAMADYLIRYRLVPDLDLRTIFHALDGSPAHIHQPPPTEPMKAEHLPVRIPAQWEEMERIIVSWPVMYPPLWDLHASMIEAITPVAQVTVIVPAPMWGRAAWLYLALREKADMDQVQFLHIPVNDIWVRDYGPMIGYDKAGQRVALNAIYDHLAAYPQALDDAMPVSWSAHAGLPMQDVHLHTEGGNLWTDGEGTLLMSRQVFNENPHYTRETLETYLHNIYDYDKLIITPRLEQEETGHIDLVMKLASRDTILMPLPASPELREARELLQNETNAQGEPYNLVVLPAPPLYYNWFRYPVHRSYTNSLTVNGRVLVPVYGLQEDKVALRTYEYAMPDHEIIPINCKTGINGGGSVHCMTKEVPCSRSAL